MKLLLLIFRNLRRSWLRTTLTALGTIVLVVVVTMSWSFLAFFDDVTAEKSKNFKAIVTERWQIPSQMPLTYAPTLTEGAARNPGDIRPTDSMSWQFYGGTLDPKNMTRENMVFAIAVDPKKIGTMMDELEELTGEQKAELDRLIADLAGMLPEFDAAGSLEIVEDRVGTGSTDFWGISFAPSSTEHGPMTEAEFDRELRGWLRDAPPQPFRERSLFQPLCPEVRQRQRRSRRAHPDLWRHRGRPVPA
jgi:hypothetical protein